MKPRYNEGARDRQNMFGRTRFPISRFYSIYFITEPLYEYLQTSISLRVVNYIANRRVFSREIVAYQTDIKNFFLLGNAANELSATTTTTETKNWAKQKLWTCSTLFVRFLWHHCRTSVVKPSWNSNAIVATSISSEIPIQRLIINGEKYRWLKRGLRCVEVRYIEVPLYV